MQPGQVQLWRIVNSASRDLVTLCPPTGINWQQIAQDGVQLAFQNVQNNQPVSLAAGNRADLLVQVPATASGLVSVNAFEGALAPPASPAANCAAGKDPAGDAYAALMTINVTGTAVSPAQQLLTAANYNAYWIANTATAANAVIMPLANNPGGCFFRPRLPAPQAVQPRSSRTPRPRVRPLQMAVSHGRTSVLRKPARSQFHVSLRISSPAKSIFGVKWYSIAFRTLIPRRRHRLLLIPILRRI